MVPNGWNIKTLGNFCEFSQGFQVGVDAQMDFCAEGLVRFVRIVDYTKAVEPPRYVRKLENYYLVAKDDLVMVRYGEAGLICRGIEGVIANNLFRIKPKEQDSDKAYLYTWLEHHQIQISRLAASSTMPALKFSDLKSLNIALPPIAEQRKIAKILSTWDKAISTTERLIDNSKQQKKALMQQLLTGKKRLLDDSGKPFEGEFDRVNLSELATIDKSSLGKKTPEDFEFSYISLSDVETGKIADNLEKHVFSSSPSRARRKVSCGDILLATVRPNLKGFAKVKAEHDGMIASTGFSVLTPKKGVAGDYLYHYLFSCHITGQINALVVGSNYPAINSSDVSGLKVYIPSYDEQKKVASVLNNADQSLAQLEQQLADLKQEKKALMQQLLTGKRRVKIDDKEVA